MSLPNALAGRRLWLLGVASLAALLALAVAALGPLQQHALADGHELPPELAFNLQLIEDSDNIVPAGSELKVRATISHSGPPLADTATQIEAPAANKMHGTPNIFSFSEAALRVSGSFEWESDASTGSRLNLADAQLVAAVNAGIDQASDALNALSPVGDNDPLEGAATNGDPGLFQPVAWDGRTLIGLAVAYGSSATNHNFLLQIYDTSTTRPTWKAALGSPEAGQSGTDIGWGSGIDRTNLQPGMASVAVWHEDDDTAWLFVGAMAAFQGYTAGGDEDRFAGALYIYRLAYDDDGDLTVTQETKMQPTAAENGNRVLPTGITWPGWQHAALYGSSVAVSKDGSTLAVTASQMNNTGALYVYTRPDGGDDWGDITYDDGVKVSSVNIPTWGTASSRPFDSSTSANCAASSYCAKVTALTAYHGTGANNQRSNTAGRHGLQGQSFGIGKIGISADGTTIAVGAPARQYPDTTAGGSFTGGTDQGIVYIFEAPGGDWSSTPNFKTGKTEIATDAAAAAFTEAGHYSAGPDKRLVSAKATLRPRASWTTTAENFGTHVDLSDDGSTLAVSSGLPTTNGQFGDWARRSMAYIFERPGSSWSSSTAPDASYTLSTSASIWAPAGLDLNPAGDTLVFGQIDYQHGTVSSAGRAVVIKKGDGWADATIANTALTASDTMWQLVQPFYDATDQTTRFGNPLYRADGGGLVIGASGLAAGTDHPGNIWNWHQLGDAPCVASTLDSETTTTCALTVPDMGKVVIPNGSPDGAFTISGSVKVTRGVDVTGPPERKAPSGTIRGALEVTVGKVDEVASVEIGVASFRPDPTKRETRSYPTTLRASGNKTRLQLKILNAGGKATAAGNLASVLVTSTGGKLSLVPTTVVRGNATSTSCTDLSCQITTSSINAANAANILLELEHNNRPTTAQITVQVLSSAGKSLRSEPLAIVLAGAAETISVAEPIVGVLNVDQVGSDEDGNDVDTTTGTTQDELLLAVSAKDKGGNTVAVPGALNGRAKVFDSDGNLVRSGITATFPARRTTAIVDGRITAVTEGCTTTSIDGSGGRCVATGADPRNARDADNPAIVTSTGLFQVKIDVDATASSPLKGGEYTVEVTAGGKTGTAKFNVSGGPAADGFALSGPEGRQAVGEQFTIEATVNDSEGNPVPDNTEVNWINPQTTSGAGRATLVVSVSQDERTKDGKASNTYLVVGAGSVVIRATAGAGADAVSVQLGGAAPTAEPVNPADALSSRNPDDFTNWLGTGRTSASALLNGLDGISSILLWLNGEWLRYGVVDGREIPGSQNFTVNPGSVLWLSR